MASFLRTSPSMARGAFLALPMGRLKRLGKKTSSPSCATLFALNIWICLEKNFTRVGPEGLEPSTRRL